MKCPFRPIETKRVKYTYTETGKVDKILEQRSLAMSDCVGEACPFYDNDKSGCCRILTDEDI